MNSPVALRRASLILALLGTPGCDGAPEAGDSAGSVSSGEFACDPVGELDDCLALATEHLASGASGLDHEFSTTDVRVEQVFANMDLSSGQFAAESGVSFRLCDAEDSCASVSIRDEVTATSVDRDEARELFPVDWVPATSSLQPVWEAANSAVAEAGQCTFEQATSGSYWMWAAEDDGRDNIIIIGQCAVDFGCQVYMHARTLEWYGVNYGADCDGHAFPE